MSDVEQAVADAHRREWAFVLAATVRVTRDLDMAEEAVQDAYVQALRTWGRDGVPGRPGAWLTTVARRRALNAVRRRTTLDAKLPLLLGPLDTASTTPEPPGPIEDDRLRLIFTCCHPALAQEAQVALTLRLVCGVATPDIAQAFLVTQATMAARITRAKRKIAVARIPFAVPAADLPARLDAVLSVIHLLYATGHTAPSGDELVQDELTSRALDLARLLRRLLPAEREAAGLLALLLVHQARRATRTDRDGRLLRLEEQDRGRWDRELIAEADRLVVGALEAGPPGRFTLQAAIAALHAQAPTYAVTDWPQILTLYDALAHVWPSPVVALNRAVAVAMVEGPAVALAEVEALERDARLAGYRYLPATKADLLHRLGRDTEAVQAYREALALSDNAAEQDFLAERVRSTQAGSGGPPQRSLPDR
jgi:RNA polymerase sigma-70 factor (ECF subfamily)